MNYKELSDSEWSVLSSNWASLDQFRDSDVFDTYKHKLDWYTISSNFYGTNHQVGYFLECNQSLINWSALSSNTNPGIRMLLFMNKDKLDWRQLSANYNAIRLLAENPDKIDWEMAATNPKVIEYLRPTADEFVSGLFDDYLSVSELFDYLPKSSFKCEFEEIVS